jgi:PhnB protein
VNRPDYVREGYPTVAAYIMVPDAGRVLEFARTVFGAEVIRSDQKEDGTLGHSEFRIGDSMVMLGDTGTEWPAMPAALHVYVPDVDRVWQLALDNGATSIREPADQPHGDRMGGVSDAAGNQWWIASMTGR